MSVDASKVLTSDSWPVGTRLQLLNVPWDENYRDVVAWESEAARDAWFASQESASWVSDRFNYLWPNLPVAVPVPYSSAYKYNYVAVRNPEQPVDDEGPQRTYYYFVTDVSYLSPQASNLTVQLDVMTTYCGSMEFGRAFVERGHIAMANANARGELTGDKLLDYLSLPEGIDVGRGYQTVDMDYFPAAEPNIYGDGNSDTNYLIIVSTADLTISPGSVSEPVLRTANGDTADGIPTGCEVYALPIGAAGQLFSAASQYSWVTQCIIAMYAFPGRFIRLGDAVPFFGGTSFGAHKLDEFATKEVGTSENVLGRLSAYHSSVGCGGVSKLCAYPYSVIELTTWTGNSVMLRPELVSGNELALEALSVAVQPFARVGVFPENYNSCGKSGVSFSYVGLSSNDGREGTVPYGDFLDTVLWLADFPQFSIVNNSYMTYMASTANTRAYQYQSAGWQLERSNAGAVAAFENTNTSRDSALMQSEALAETARDNAGRAWIGDVAQSTLGAIGGGASSMAQGAGGVATGSGVAVGGAVAGLVGAGTQLASGLINAEMNMQSSLASAATSLANARTSYAAAGEIANNNLLLANRVSMGDYLNTIKGVLATQQDAELRPPSVSGQLGGQAFNMKYGYMGVCVRMKTIVGAALHTSCDYFRRYGYEVRRWLPMGTLRHLLCMSKFAYWKVLESTVTAADANESERHTMRGVLEKGVTLWDAPESIGTTDLSDNQPRDGYSY